MISSVKAHNSILDCIRTYNRTYIKKKKKKKFYYLRKNFFFSLRRGATVERTLDIMCILGVLHTPGIVFRIRVSARCFPGVAWFFLCCPEAGPK